MHLEWILKGLLLGITIAAPVGPICMLCIKKTLNSGFLAGLFAGLGVATADAVYGFIAGLGLTSITHLVLGYASSLQLLGGLFIGYLGLRTLFLRHVTESHVIKQSNLSSYLTTFMLTLSNPMTILFFLSIFTATKVSLSDVGVIGMPLLVTGVFIGSLLWWTFLAGMITLIGSKILNPSLLDLVNRLSAVILICVGIWTIL
jgi:threonine/homoserine/homoserine lactone efflux protein